MNAPPGSSVAPPRRGRGAIARRLARRSSAISAGLLIVLVPTLFAVFPHWGSWPVGVRVAIIAVWLAAAVVVVYASTRQSEAVEELVDATRERASESRLATGRYVLDLVLRPGAGGFANHYEFRLYAPDPDRPVVSLREEFSSTGALTDERWAPSQGAVGAAWSSASLIRDRGPRVSDATYGLTAEQQQLYRHLAVVAAAPVLDAAGRPIAVLSVASNDDDGYLFERDGAAALARLADVVARVLIDLIAPARQLEPSTPRGTVKAS